VLESVTLYVFIWIVTVLRGGEFGCSGGLDWMGTFTEFRSMILVWKRDSFGFFLFTTSLMIDVALYTRIATSSSPEGGV
jgi:hypothetical protein